MQAKCLRQADACPAARQWCGLGSRHSTAQHSGGTTLSVRSLTARLFWAIQASLRWRSPAAHRSRWRLSSLAQPSFRLLIWPAWPACTSCRSPSLPQHLSRTAGCCPCGHLGHPVQPLSWRDQQVSSRARGPQQASSSRPLTGMHGSRRALSSDAAARHLADRPSLSPRRRSISLSCRVAAALFSCRCSCRATCAQPPGSGRPRWSFPDRPGACASRRRLSAHVWLAGAHNAC